MNKHSRLTFLKSNDTPQVVGKFTRRTFLKCQARGVFILHLKSISYKIYFK